MEILSGKMVNFELDFFFLLFLLTDKDEKTILNLEISNKNLSGELREVKKDLSQLQENLKISENMNLQFENQLNKTIRNLSTVMDEIHTVLKKVSYFLPFQHFHSLFFFRKACLWKF